MTPPRPGYANPPVNLSSEELSALENNLRFELGPSVITSERAKELRTMLTLVDKDIEGLSPESALLETQRAKLLLLLSPMRKLPNETLLHILQDVCDENLLQCYPWRMNENPPTMTSPIITYLPTMVISSVCSRWRNLALSSPSLWTNLAVKTYTTSSVEGETFVGFTNTVTRYLKRSGNSPLSLELTIEGPTEFEEIPCLVELTQYACRWKTLKLSNSDHLLTEYRILSGICFPMLNIVEGATSEDWDLFGDCPSLCALWPVCANIQELPQSRAS